MSDKDIDGDSVPDLLIRTSISLIQGESDANSNLETAQRYSENLEQLVSALRTALRNDNLPVVIGKITDSKMAEDVMIMDHIVDVQEAQAQFTKAGRCAELATITDELNHRDDAWQYDTHGSLRLGKAFAVAFLNLENTCSQGRTS